MHINVRLLLLDNCLVVCPGHFDFPAFLPNMENIKHIVMVLSGKGGVGKSTITTELALTLHARGLKIGVLDIDLTGPSIKEMFGVQGKIMQSSKGWIPLKTENLQLVSLGYLVNDEAVIWRGPKKQAMIKQFCENILWDDLDYLIIDTPPGTSDEHISIVQFLKQYSPTAIIVTTPQAVSLTDVQREINFCRKVGVPIGGLIENMSGFKCPHCDCSTDLFSSGGGEMMASNEGIKFLGKVPIDPMLSELMEGQGRIFKDAFFESQMCHVLSQVVDNYLNITRDSNDEISPSVIVDSTGGKD